jgi:hypothetical protein
MRDMMPCPLSLWVHVMCFWSHLWINHVPIMLNPTLICSTQWWMASPGWALVIRGQWNLLGTMVTILNDCMHIGEPSRPQHLSFALTDVTVRLDWDPPLDSGGVAITHLCEHISTSVQYWCYHIYTRQSLIEVIECSQWPWIYEW